MTECIRNTSLKPPDSCAATRPRAMGPASECPEPLRRRLAYHRLMCFSAIVVLALALVLQVRPDQRVALVFLPNVPLPEICFSRSMIGVVCPACGLTRSFIRLAHGQFTASLRENRIGWLPAAAVLFQIPYRLYMLRQLIRRGHPELSRHLSATVVWSLLVAAVIVNWVLTLAGL
ncbi:MAG: DUF2752 domain-containing protein [Planctomycetaceae bacterium]